MSTQPRTTLPGILSAIDGDSQQPGICFLQEPGIGFYRSTTSTIVGIGTFSFTTLNITTSTITNLTIGTQLFLPNGSASFPSITFTSDTDTGIYRIGTNILGFLAGGVATFAVNQVSVNIASAIPLGWGPVAAPDTFLYRDGSAGILALKNADNAQEFRVYGAVTGSKYLRLYHTASAALLVSNYGPLYVRAAAATKVIIGDPNVDAIQIYAAALANAEAITLLDMATTWNTSGTPTAIKLNITDTASNANSLLMDLQTGAVSKFSVSKVGNLVTAGANAQKTSLLFSTVQSGAMSGATLTLTNLIPAGSLVFGVTVHPTTAITSGDGATTYNVGDGTDADRWGAAIAFANDVNLTNITIASPVYYAAATNVVLTAIAGTFNAGVVRVTVHYMTLTAATS